MQRERVADDIYVFTSDLYAQVTATAVITSEGIVLLDTLMFPQETQQMKAFLTRRLGKDVIYVIHSHFHADHTMGTCFFPEARVVGHTLCRRLLDRRGRDALKDAQETAEELRSISLVLPDVVFSEGTLTLYVGNKTLRLWHTPGHSPDGIVCAVEEDRVLLAADTLMPIPYFVDGSYDDFVQSLKGLQQGSYENIVQGHGEVILRGEIDDKLASDLNYLEKLRTAVDHALAHGTLLEKIDIENCGKSRVLLNGAVQQLHRQNVLALAQQRRELIQEL
jgi:cyclase